MNHNGDMSKGDVIAMLKYDIGDNFRITPNKQTLEYNLGDSGPQYMTGWGYFQDYYYPRVIRESYPVYVQEKALDKGKQAFEVLKILQDKKLLKVDKVSDFIEAMDALIKVL